MFLSRTLPIFPSRSTNVAWTAPRESASSPYAPEPAHASRTFAPATRVPRMSNAAFRAISVVGRTPRGTSSRRPRYLPPVMRTTGAPSGPRRGDRRRPRHGRILEEARKLVPEEEHPVPEASRFLELEARLERVVADDDVPGPVGAVAEEVPLPEPFRIPVRLLRVGPEEPGPEILERSLRSPDGQRELRQIVRLEQPGAPLRVGDLHADPPALQVSQGPLPHPPRRRHEERVIADPPDEIELGPGQLLPAKRLAPLVGPD